MARPHQSLWLRTTPTTSYPHLDGTVNVDVAIVGGGIVGITAAALLKEAGVRVALVEAERLASSVTGHTTAKFTALHTVVYDKLVRSVGLEHAQMYAAASVAAMGHVLDRISALGIDCDLEFLPAYTYTERQEHLEEIQREVLAARDCGLNASYVMDAGLPYPVLGAVKLPNQMQLHPRKYLLPLAETIPGAGSSVFERSRVVDLQARVGSQCEVRTDTGCIRADRVIVATHIPFMLRGLYFAKESPNRAYVVASPAGRDSTFPQGMYITVESPSRSVRTALGRNGERLLLVSGDGHRPGEGGPDTDVHYTNLERFSRERFGTRRAVERWSTQDYFPHDHVPFVGPVGRVNDRVMVATGFSGWGMTNGTAAAMMLAELCQGRRAPWFEVFRADRGRPLLKPKVMREAALTSRHLVVDRFTADREEPAVLAPGEGRVLRVDGENAAVYRDEAGVLHAVSPTCTHMGCQVAFNHAERSWDCPCHGSRFDVDGAVLQGPAVSPLEKVALPVQGEGSAVHGEGQAQAVSPEA